MQGVFWSRLWWLAAQGVTVMAGMLDAMAGWRGAVAGTSRSQLLDQVWGDHVFVEERTVDVHIRRLRSALGPSGHDALVQTVRGTGYRFSAQG